MTHLTRAIAALLLASCVGMTAFALASLILPGAELIPDRPSPVEVLTFATIFLAFPSVGLVVAWRQPANPVGWLFLVIGVSITLGVFAGEYAGRSMYAGGDLPGAVVLAWVGNWSWTIASSIALPLALMLFPNGRLPSARWRPPVTVAVAAALVVTAAFAFRPGPLDSLDGRFSNPYGLPGAAGALADSIAQLDGGLMAFMALLALAAVVTRSRRTGTERQQMKWFLYPTAIFVGALVAAGITAADPAWMAVLLSLASIPVAAGIAILRYRLYDIDVVIRRTLVYGVVVAILAAVYVGLVLAFQAALSGMTGGGTLPVALSTLAIAALFGPVRRRVRQAVDRRFYRSRYDATNTVAALAAELRDEVELGTVGERLVRVAANAVRPAGIGLWMRPR